VEGYQRFHVAGTHSAIAILILIPIAMAMARQMAPSPISHERSVICLAFIARGKFLLRRCWPSVEERQKSTCQAFSAKKKKVDFTERHTNQIQDKLRSTFIDSLTKLL